MANDLVSILMPVFKTPEPYLRESVTSVLAQTHTNLELIIVEDPSDQPCTDIIASFEDPRIRYHLNEARTSLLAQRNKTIELAHGDFLALLDSDDIAEPNRLELQLKFLQDHPDVDVVGSHIAIINEQSQIQGARSYPEQHTDIINTMKVYNALANPAVMLRKSVFDRCGHYEYSSFKGIGEDYEFWSRCAQAGVRFANIPRNLIRYRVHAHATKAEKFRQHLDATILIKKKYWRDSMGPAAIARYYLEHVIRHLPAALVTGLFKAIYYTKSPRKQSVGG